MQYAIAIYYNRKRVGYLTAINTMKSIPTLFAEIDAKRIYERYKNSHKDTVLRIEEYSRRTRSGKSNEPR